MNDFTLQVILSPAPDWLIDAVILRQGESAVLFNVTYLCSTDSPPVREYSRRFLQAGFDLFRRWLP